MKQSKLKRSSGGAISIFITTESLAFQHAIALKLVDFQLIIHILASSLVWIELTLNQ